MMETDQTSMIFEVRFETAGVFRNPIQDNRVSLRRNQHKIKQIIIALRRSPFGVYKFESLTVPEMTDSQFMVNFPPDNTHI
jgi:hypothetical protein